MLDALFGASQSSKNQQQDELQALIAQAREERAALERMLTQMAGGTSKLAQISKALEQVGQKAEPRSRSSTSSARRSAATRIAPRGSSRSRSASPPCSSRCNEAQRVSEKITAPDGELQKHRLAVNQLASQALENQATIETLRKERARSKICAGS